MLKIVLDANIVYTYANNHTALVEARMEVFIYGMFKAGKLYKGYLIIQVRKNKEKRSIVFNHTPPPNQIKSNYFFQQTFNVVGVVVSVAVHPTKNIIATGGLDNNVIIYCRE